MHMCRDTSTAEYKLLWVPAFVMLLNPFSLACNSNLYAKHSVTKQASMKRSNGKDFPHKASMKRNEGEGWNASQQRRSWANWMSSFVRESKPLLCWEEPMVEGWTSKSGGLQNRTCTGLQSRSACKVRQEESRIVIKNYTYWPHKLS